MNSLKRFLDAQKEDHFIALREIRAGEKRTHWMWYIFPILKGQGRSDYALLYGLDGLEEAQSFLAHPILGKRLREITEAVLTHPFKPIQSIMSSSTDAWKFKVCMTIFDFLSPNDIFARAINTFCNGQRDEKTIRILNALQGPSYSV